MEKEIRFKACLSREDGRPSSIDPCLFWWFIEINKDQMKQITKTFPDWNFHVTLSPIGQEPKPDCEAMLKDIKGFIAKKEDLPAGRWFWKDIMEKIQKIETKHTPKEKPEAK